MKFLKLILTLLTLIHSTCVESSKRDLETFETPKEAKTPKQTKTPKNPKSTKTPKGPKGTVSPSIVPSVAPVEPEVPITNSSSYDIGCIYPKQLGNNAVFARYLQLRWYNLNPVAPIDVPDGVPTQPHTGRFSFYNTACSVLCLAYHNPDIMDPFTKMPTFMTVPSFGQNAYSVNMCAPQCLQYTWETYYDAVPVAREEFQKLGLDVTDPSDRPDIEAAMLEFSESKSTDAIMTILENEAYHPFTVGHLAGVQVKQIMVSDGYNSEGNMRWSQSQQKEVPCTANCRPFQDTTGYQPVPDPRVHTNLSSDSSKYNCTGYCRHWQPEESFGTPTGTITKKTFTLPHIGTKVKPYLRNETLSLEDPNYDYYEESLHVVERLRETSSDSTKKSFVSWFRNSPTKGVHRLRGPLQSTILNKYASQINFVDHTLLWFGYSLLEFDSYTLVWKEKVKHDLVRPATVIKQWGEDQLNTFGGVTTLDGPVTISASDFETYLPSIDSTAEFPSLHSCFCTTLMEFTDLYTEEMYGGTLQNFTFAGLTFEDTDDYRNKCGESMLWGGFNYPASITAGEKLCSGLGELALQYLKDLDVGSNDLDGWWKPGDVVPACPSTS